MLRKFFLICLIGWLSIVSIPNTAWANALPTRLDWLAQSQPNVQISPSEEPHLVPSTKIVNPSEKSAEQTPSEQIPAEQVSTDNPLAKNRSQSKPFNPYDMQALKQFDKGSHRTQ